MSELQAVFQSFLFSTFTAFPCSRCSTGKPVVLSQLFPTHFTQIQQYSPLQDIFPQLNKEDGSRIEGKNKRYLINFSTNPTSPDTELLLIVIIIPHFIVPNIDFIRRTFPWNSVHDTAAHLCCKSVRRHLLCACHVSSFLQWAAWRYSSAERSTLDCWVQPSPGSLTWRCTAAHWWRAVQEEVGTSSHACRRWSWLEWKDCRSRSVQSYHQVNGDDLDASKVSNSRCVRADAALSLRPIRYPFAAFFLAKRILWDFIVMDCGCKVG